MKTIGALVLMIAFLADPALCAPNDHSARSGQAKDASVNMRRGEKVGDGTLSPNSSAQPKQGMISPDHSGTTNYPKAPSRLNDDRDLSGNREGGFPVSSVPDNTRPVSSTGTAPGPSRPPVASPSTYSEKASGISASPGAGGAAGDMNGSRGQIPAVNPTDVAGENPGQDPIEIQPLVPRMPGNREQVLPDQRTTPDPQQSQPHDSNGQTP